MLIPRRVKHRKQHCPHRTGNATGEGSIEASAADLELQESPITTEAEANAEIATDAPTTVEVTESTEATTETTES